MFPFYMVPPAQQSQQKSFKEQIQDAEDMIKFFKDKYEPKDKKPDWKNHKFSLWETAFLMLVCALMLALPTTLWIIHELAAIKAAILAL